MSILSALFKTTTRKPKINETWKQEIIEELLKAGEIVTPASVSMKYQCRLNSARNAAENEKLGIGTYSKR